MRVRPAVVVFSNGCLNLTCLKVSGWSVFHLFLSPLQRLSGQSYEVVPRWNQELSDCERWNFLHSPSLSRKKSAQRGLVSYRESHRSGSPSLQIAESSALLTLSPSTFRFFGWLTASWVEQKKGHQPQNFSYLLPKVGPLQAGVVGYSQVRERHDFFCSLVHGIGPPAFRSIFVSRFFLPGELIFCAPSAVGSSTEVDSFVDPREARTERHFSPQNPPNSQVQRSTFVAKYPGSCSLGSLWWFLSSSLGNLLCMKFTNLTCQL